ncbi:MAG: hypothetical protein RIB45_03890 [Marivibrio sp.]|uniref:hypothetical protein n=1 Tax=Marivibrio sp. TaxID=2039719 RepID=UPI0032ED68CD
MQALKGVVIFMGVLLIGGVTVLVYLIATGAGKRAEEAAAMRAPASIGLQAGERLVEMRPDGPRLYLHIDGPDGARILVLDAQDGAPLGEIDLNAP